MNKVIQLIKINDDVTIFISDFDVITNKLKFRTSYEPKYLQEEVIIIDKDMIRTNLYFFSIGYIQKFIKENNLIPKV